MGFVFDGFTIIDGARATVATIDRPVGPLENGYFQPDGTWVPSATPERLPIVGFGIDGDGTPYFDTNRASPGEEADLWIDTTQNRIWLQR